jgi:hypothetical protein
MFFLICQAVEWFVSTLYNFVAASPREPLANFLFFRLLITPSAMNFAKK